MRINSEEKIIRSVIDHIENKNQQNLGKNVVILSGHFPVTQESYSSNKEIERKLVTNLAARGAYSTYSFELGCRIGSILAGDSSMNISFAILADDKNSSTTRRAPIEKKLFHKGLRKKLRKEYFKNFSDDVSKLPNDLQVILNKYGFETTDVLRHTQTLENIANSLIFSEQKLERHENTKNIENLCARSVIGLYKNHIKDPQSTHLVSLFPQRCQDNICSFMYEEQEDEALDEFKSISHIFMPAKPLISRKGIYNNRPIQIIQH